MSETYRAIDSALEKVPFLLSAVDTQRHNQVIASRYFGLQAYTYKCSINALYTREAAMDSKRKHKRPKR